MSDLPPTTPASSANLAPQRGARRSTLVVMVATLLTKVVGLAREVVVAAMFGAGATMSAFTVAFQIPNVIKTFVADQALISSLVPVFTDLREKGEEERAWRVASTIVSVLLLLLIPLTILAMIAAPFLVDLAVHDYFEQMDLAVTLFRIMFPVVILMSIGGVIIGILNAHGRFGPPAFAQLSWNAVALLVLIGASPFVAEQHRIHVYAWAVLVGTVVQMLLPAPWLRGHGYRLTLGTAFRDPAVKAIVIAMLPVMLSLAMLNLNNIVNTYWSSRVPLHLLDGLRDSGPAVVDKAFRIFQLPQGIFSLAVATVFFPLFARHSVRNDTLAFREAASAGMRQIIILLMPASIFLYVLSEPVVRLLYQRGEFTATHTDLVSQALQGFALGLIGNGGIQLLMRAFFSLRQQWTPVVIGFVFNLLGNVIAGGLLHAHFGVFGIATSMAIANTVSFLAMWIVLRHRLGGMPVRPVASAFIVSLVLAAGATAAGWAVWHFADDALGRGALGQLISMTGALVITYGIYVTLAIKLKLVRIDGIKSALKRGN